MPKSKKRKFERKSPRRYKLVEFEDPIYGETFKLPSLETMPGKVVDGLNVGNFAPVKKWFSDAGVSQDEIDAFLWLDQDDINDFQAAWADGTITIPKSSESGTSTDSTQSK